MDLINATPLLEPTETAVILAIVDEFNKARMAERRGNSVKVLDPQIESFNNSARELMSKYRTKIITRQELFTEAAASGRRIFHAALNGETNVTSRSDHPTT